jgi:hypothetical protein
VGGVADPAEGVNDAVYRRMPEPFSIASNHPSAIKYENRTGGAVSTVYNPEAEVIAQIERLELEVREVRRRIEHANNQADKRVLNKQIDELKSEIEFLRTKVD